MPEETLHVYVSSTWLDLQPERAAVLAMTNRLRGLSFLGMEFFGSRDESTEETSLDQLDHADVYVGIIGGRYGSGITEQEYLRAHERGLPAFIYFKLDAADGAAADDGDHRLQAFRLRLQQEHTCSEFATAGDLVVKLAADLHNWMFERHLARGLAGFSTDYLSRVQAFLAEYVGGRDRHVPFGGRADELAWLNRWLAEPDAPPFLFVGAGAGKGKSALLVRWMRELLDRDDIAPAFFPISIRFRTNLASVVFPCLATCLAALHGEPLRTTPDTPPEVWRGLVTDLLGRKLRDGRTLVLIVDGLDEAADWTAGPDLFPRHAGRHARVVVAARFLAGDVDSGDWCRRLGWDAPQTAGIMTLSALRVSGVAEVLERMGFPLAVLGERSEIVQELHRLSEGEPLVVRLYVDDLSSRGEASTRLEVEDLCTIEPGLSGYFARWWDDQRRLWGATRPLQEGRVQALMNFLASALGPLTRDDIFALASPIVELNTWTLEEALEPLQRFVVGDGVESGYVYSHPGLAIHFRERLSRGEREALDNRILAWCIESIEAVAEGQRGPLEISSYVLQHFGAHLERQDCDVEAFAPLLTDAWRRAWHAHDGTYAGYRADLRRVQMAASRHARSTTGRPSLTLETHAALCMASVDQLSDNTPPELVVALVQKGVWSRAGAVGYARLIRDPVRRARALTYLASVVTEATQAQVLREVLESIVLVEDTARVPLLLAVAPELSRPLVGDALTLALALDNRAMMADALIGLAPRLTPWHVDKALGAVCRLADPDLRRRILTELAAAHPSIFEPWADAAEQLEPWERAWTLLGVHDGLGPAGGRSVLDKAASLAGRVASEVARLDLLIAIAERLQPADRRPTIEWVLREVSALSYAQARAMTFRRLAALVDDAEAATMTDRALAECARIRSDSARAEALAALAPFLLEPGAEAALMLAEAIVDDAARGRAAAALVPMLSGAARPRALKQAQSITDSFERLCILASVADFLPQEELADAVAWVEREQTSPASRFRLMQKLAPRAGDALGAMPSTDFPMDPLDELAACAGAARFCPPGVRPAVDARVLSIVAADRVYFLWDERLDEALEFLSYWAEDAPLPSLVRVTDAVLKWETTASRIAGIERLAPYLPVHLLEESLRRLQTLGDDRVRRDTQMQYLALLGPDHVTGRLARFWRRAAAADRVLQTLRWLEDGSGDGRLLRADVIAMMPEIASGPRRAEAMTTFMRLIGSTITADEMTVLIDAAVSLADPVYRASTMSWLVPRIQREHLDRFAEILSASIEDSTEAVTTAAAVAVQVPPDQLLDVFAGLCSTELQSLSWDVYVRAPRLLGLARLARALPNPLGGAMTDRLVAAIEGVSADRRGRALTQFGRWLIADEDFFARAFVLSRSLPSVERIEAAVSLLRRLSGAALREALDETIDFVKKQKDAQTWVVAALEGASAEVAARGAWRAGIVLESLPALLRPDIPDLLTLAVDELRQQSNWATTNSCTALVAAAPADMRDGLVALAVDGLRHLDLSAQAVHLRRLDAALSSTPPERIDVMASLAPYVDGEHISRFTQLLGATADASGDLADLIANLGWRLSDEGFLHVVAEVCSREVRRGPSLGDESARQLSRIARIAALRDEPTRAATTDRVVSTIRSLDRSAGRDIIWHFGRRELGDHTFDWWAALARELDPGERISAYVQALPRLPLEQGPAVIGELIAWIEELSPRRRAQAIAAQLEGLSSQLASCGAWRAALVVEWLAADHAQTGESAGAAAVADLAFEDLREHPPIELTAAAAVVLLPFASMTVRERLVALALGEIRHQSEPARKARVVRALVAHAPPRSMTLLVRQSMTLLRAPDGAGAGEVIAELVGELLPHVTAVHAGRLWRDAMKRGLPSTIVDVFVDRLPEEAMTRLSGAMLGAICRTAEPSRTRLLRRWVGRLPPSGLERLSADVRAGQSAACTALALALAVPRVPEEARERLKAAAVDALTSPGSIDWDGLVSMQRAVGDEPWPALGARMADALRRETSASDLVRKAAEVIGLLSGRARTDVAACVLERLSTVVPDGVDVVTGGMQLEAQELAQLLHALAGARDSPAERMALLLPLVPPAQRKVLVERVTETNHWIYDSRLFDSVCAYASDPSVALLLADRAIDVPFKGAGLGERVLDLWSRVPTDSPAWHALSAHLVFAVAFDSRTDLMRLLQRMAPTVQQALGPGASEQIVESLESISEWWP